MIGFLKPAHVLKLFYLAINVAWIRPLKCVFFLKWNNWLINAQKAYTKADNRKSLGHYLVVEWISQCCLELYPSVIIRSFDQCGLASRNMRNFFNLVIFLYPAYKKFKNYIFLKFSYLDRTLLFLPIPF